MGSPCIAVVGAGFGGIAAVVVLKQAGYRNVVVFEKGDEVGGVWRANTYPEAACDVPAPFYSYSFAPNPRWPHRFARQPAILAYLKEVADRYDVHRQIRFGCEVTAAAFDKVTGKWTVSFRAGDAIEVDMLVSAVGQLSRPSVPPITGLESFEGVTFHSAEWDQSVDLSGRRVAVIGTGASAIQFVPGIQPQVDHLDVFQRSAPYLLPRPDREYNAVQHKLFQRLPRRCWLNAAFGTESWKASALRGSTPNRSKRSCVGSRTVICDARPPPGQSCSRRCGRITRSGANESCSLATTCRR
jgi:cation diffusion facilitator CzcD-associated flavoprotein CzcO